MCIYVAMVTHCKLCISSYMLANLLCPCAQMANNEKSGLCDPMKRRHTNPGIGKYPTDYYACVDYTVIAIYFPSRPQSTEFHRKNELYLNKEGTREESRVKTMGLIAAKAPLAALGTLGGGMVLHWSPVQHRTQLPLWMPRKEVSVHKGAA